MTPVPPDPVFREPQAIFFSADVERAAAFYRRLGFTETFRTPAHGVPIHIDLELDGYKLGFASLDSSREHHGLDPVTSGQRATVTVWTDDTAGAYQALTGEGIPGLAGPQRWLDRLLIAWVLDPDGHPVQIVQELSNEQGHA